MDLKQHIRTIPDFPKPGILFYDIATLFAHAEALKNMLQQLATAVAPLRPQLLAGIESRGFLVGAPLAQMMGLGFVMLRKTGKLPGEVIPHSYDLEYGSATLEIQTGLIEPGQRVVLVDDLLATGGTLEASITLLRKVGAEVAGAACIMELTFLQGRDKIDVPLEVLLSYDS
ncbi:MAG: adenine phosphoribosyltransferase [Rhodospirillales bacterium]